MWRHTKHTFMARIVVEAALTVAAADLVSGVVHWVEDAYARPDARLLGPLAEANLRHHWRPREFLQKSWWSSSWDLLLASAVVVALAAAFDVLTWQVALFALLVANANQIHKWTHMTRAEVPAPVRWLQNALLLQTPRHHARHHGGARNSHYCVMTNFVNPMLEEVMLWSRLERLIERTTGLKRRSEADELASLGLTAASATISAKPQPRCARCAATIAQPIAQQPA
jgi:plasmanylethanolamine desaturase